MLSEDSEIIVVFVSAAIIILLMAVLIAFFVAIYQKRILRQNEQLQILEVKFQKAMLKATIEGQERERKRLAKDLHDGIGSLLTGVKLHLKHQQYKIKATTEQAEFITEAFSMLDEGISEVRRVSHNLLPVTLESFGLYQALDECIEPMQQPGTLHISLASKGTMVRLDPDMELGMLRVAQELLQNTVRHAQASAIEICLRFSPSAVVLEYDDNGVGMPHRQPESGLGMMNMKSRIQALNGTLAISNRAGGGFHAEIRMPLSQMNPELIDPQTP